MGDLALSRLLQLPPATTGYTVARALPVPMRDGVDLLADLYAPATGPGRGTLLARTPYGRAGVQALFFARFYAARGYHVVLQSCRGTFGSGGTFRPAADEARDGADTVSWLRAQPWFTGTFATIGLSYLGLAQWALLTNPPPELTAAVIIVGPHDLQAGIQEGGAFALQNALVWADAMAHPQSNGLLRGPLRALTNARRLNQALNILPLRDTGHRLLAGQAPWYRDWIDRPDPADPQWRDMQLPDALDRVEVPVLLIGGWHDPWLRQTLEQYSRLHNRGVDVAVTIGPWTHLDMIGKAARTTSQQSLDWLAEHLAHDAPRRRMSPVRVYVTGAERWRDLPAWPPPTQDTVLYLRAGSQLSDQPPAADEQAGTSFVYDPADPTPTVGGPLLTGTAGSRDNTKLEARRDVLTFTGPALTHDLEVTGCPVAELAHHSDNPHVDLFVRLCQVDQHGRSLNLAEGLVRRQPDQRQPDQRQPDQRQPDQRQPDQRQPDQRQPDQVVTLELTPLAHRFLAGARVRLQVSGGSHPRFVRNLAAPTSAARAPRVRSRRTEPSSTPLQPPPDSTYR